MTEPADLSERSRSIGPADLRLLGDKDSDDDESAADRIIEKTSKLP